MEKVNRTTVIIASAIFAIGLWLTVNLGFDHTTVKNVPVVIQNLPDNLSLRTPPPEHIRARLRGEGWKLLGMQLGGETKYIIDLRGQQSSIVVQTQMDLSERMRLPTGIEVLELSPERFTIDLEEKTQKRVPVEPDIQVTFRNGFNRIGPIRVTPDSITITGARSVLAGIDKWKTKPLVLNDIREPVRRTVYLSDTLTTLVTRNQQTVTVHFDVQPIAEKTITGLRIYVEGVPANREVQIIPPRIDLVVRGGINQLAAITDDQFSAHVNYRDILADTSGVVIPHIQGPPDIRIVQQQPDRLQYVIRRLQ